MPNNEDRDLRDLTPYQAAKQKESREVWCGIVHDSIEEAIVHAERNLGIFRTTAAPYWGTTKFGEGSVVGWQVNSAKRYRLDYAHSYETENLKAAKWSGTSTLKGTQGVHVNEENFQDPLDRARPKICHPTRASLLWATTYWRKWTKRYR